MVFPMNLSALCFQRSAAETTVYNFNRAEKFTKQIQGPESEFNRPR